MKKSIFFNIFTVVVIGFSIPGFARMEKMPMIQGDSIIDAVAVGDERPDGIENTMVTELLVTVTECSHLKVVQEFTTAGLELKHVFENQMAPQKYPVCTQKAEKVYELYPPKVECKVLNKKIKSGKDVLFDRKNRFQITYDVICAAGPIVPDHNNDPYSKLSNVKVKKISFRRPPK